MRRIWGGVATAAAVLALTACGSSNPTAATRAPAATGRFPVRVTLARFPHAQRIAQTVTLTLAVRNTGPRALPDVAVSICPRSCAPSHHRGEGTAAQAFGYDVPASPTTADPSRPVWIVNRGPGACHVSCAEAGGDTGGGVTASANTWALGRLAPGATVRFSWRLTPVVAGTHRVAWEVAGDLTGRARAVAAGGGVPRGSFHVSVASGPPSMRVTPSGRVVTTAAG